MHSIQPEDAPIWRHYFLPFLLCVAGVFQRILKKILALFHSSDMLNEIEGEETTDLEASYSSSSSFPESEDPLEPLRDCHVLILCFDLSRPYTYKVRKTISY